MSKVVQAVNAMISNPKLITEVFKNGDEFFFLYKEKYKWSIIKSEDGKYRLFFYPGDDDLSEIANYGPYQWESAEMISYTDSDIGTKEARASFSELHTLVKERVYGINEVFEDIISDMEDL